MPGLAETLRESGALDFTAPRTYDAIVVGTGAAGGVACRELARSGLNVLALEAGWEETSPRSPMRNPVARLFAGISANETFRSLPAGVITLGRRGLRAVGKVRQPVQTKCFAWELSPGSLVDDRDCPYETPDDAPFNWFRSRQLGGRLIVPGHGRQYYRLGPDDFGGRGNADAAWPLDPDALDPWYDEVEKSLGMRGGNDHTDLVPDCLLSVVNTPLPSEEEILSLLSRNMPDMQPILGRYAPPANWMAQAAETGRLTIRTGAVAQRVKVDGQQNVSGAEWFDCRAGRVVSAEAPIVFLCASAFESARLLMLSRGSAANERIGMHSDWLGRCVMDHAVTSCSGYVASLAGEADERHEHGRCLYVPMLAQIRDEISGRTVETPHGVQLHRQMFGPNRARVDITGFAPMQPRAENRLTLSNRTDKFGMPILRIDCRYSEADRAVAAVQMQKIQALTEALGVAIEYQSPDVATPGTGIHECGTARMGSDPHTSVVDSNHECWDARGLFVTDAAAFPSLGAQNPTLTIMAQTARAAAYAASKQVREPVLAGAVE